jgi:hypothetical protein
MLLLGWLLLPQRCPRCCFLFALYARTCCCIRCCLHVSLLLLCHALLLLSVSEIQQVLLVKGCAAANRVRTAAVSEGTIQHCHC